MTNLENELITIRSDYNNSVKSFSDELDLEGKKLGICVERARPLYEAQRNMRRAQSQVQELSVFYKKSRLLKENCSQLVQTCQSKVPKYQRIQKIRKKVKISNNSSSSESESEEISTEMLKIQKFVLF